MKHVVVLGGLSSQAADVLSGVPHGSILISPLLFFNYYY